MELGWESLQPESLQTLSQISCISASLKYASSQCAQWPLLLIVHFLQKAKWSTPPCGHALEKEHGSHHLQGRACSDLSGGLWQSTDIEEMAVSHHSPVHGWLSVHSPGRCNSRRQETVQNHDINAKKQIWENLVFEDGSSWKEQAGDRQPFRMWVSRDTFSYWPLSKEEPQPSTFAEETPRRPWGLEVWSWRTPKYYQQKPLLVHTHPVCIELWHLSCVTAHQAHSIPDMHTLSHSGFSVLRRGGWSLNISFRPSSWRRTFWKWEEFAYNTTSPCSPGLLEEGRVLYEQIFPVNVSAYYHLDGFPW